MKKILIANAVPTNNGDAALVFGLRDKLVERGYDVIISTLKYDTIKELYPDVKWVKAEYEFNNTYNKIFKIFPFLRRVLVTLRIKSNSFYKEIDTIISAPGGYINSYYGIEERLYCMDLIKKLYNCKTVMYSQSVGPLNEYDKNILDKYMGIFDLFMARDEVSYNNVRKYKNVIRTNDAAFLLEPNISKTNKENVVAISVREWGFDGRNKEHYLNLMRQITMKCIENGNRVEFVSTCQGLSNYVDDSKIAKEIVNQLDESYKKMISIDTKYNSLDELREKIKKYKFVVGTRLHMCILSVMAGVPAFNISYEIKGKECFKILELPEYSIDYNDDIEISLQKLQLFIEKNNELKSIYEDKAIKMNEEAKKHFKYMFDNVIEE